MIVLLRTWLFCGVWAGIAQLAHASSPVEVYLLDRLDEPRAYCIDIKGHQAQAKVDRGLQAHTCYSYQGQVAVDQGFDEERLREHQFLISGFSVCMNAGKSWGRASLGLSPCDGSEGQRFTFSKDGHIRAEGANQLCLTVSSGSSRQGKGGRPVHLMRDLMLQACEDSMSNYQRWAVRGHASGESIQRFRIKNKPPLEAFSACDDKQLGDACSHRSPVGQQFGVCKAAGTELQCIPERRVDFGRELRNPIVPPRTNHDASLDGQVAPGQGMPKFFRQPSSQGGPSEYETLAHEADASTVVSDQVVQQIITQRCAGCHAYSPSLAGFRRAPKGVILETLSDVREHGARVLARSVQSHSMPLSNMTGMTEEERVQLGKWLGL